MLTTASELLQSKSSSESTPLLNYEQAAAKNAYYNLIICNEVSIAQQIGEDVAVVAKDWASVKYVVKDLNIVVVQHILDVN